MMNVESSFDELLLRTEELKVDEKVIEFCKVFLSVCYKFKTAAHN